MPLAPLFWNDQPAGVDPDFDEIDGLLTLQQVRDPVLTLGELWNPEHPTHGDPVGFLAQQRARKWHKIRQQQRQLQDLARAMTWAHNRQMERARARLKRLSHRMRQLMAWHMRRCRNRLDWLPKIKAWMATRQGQILVGRRKQLSSVSRRWLAAQLKGYPTYNFGYVYKCDKCVPYNGHHTVNYWATGQKDCW